MREKLPENITKKCEWEREFEKERVGKEMGRGRKGGKELGGGRGKGGRR